MEWIWMVQHELRLLWLEMTLRGDERGLTCQLWLLQTPARWLSGLTADNACAEPLSFVALGQRIGRTVSRQRPQCTGRTRSCPPGRPEK